MTLLIEIYSLKLLQSSQIVLISSKILKQVHQMKEEKGYHESKMIVSKELIVLLNI